MVVHAHESTDQVNVSTTKYRRASTESVPILPPKAERERVKRRIKRKRGGEYHWREQQLSEPAQQQS